MKRLIHVLFKISLYIWELPTNIVGWFLTKDKKYIHKLPHAYIYLTDKNDGMCMGRYIFIQLDSPDGILVRHEYGHRIQSLILGWLFIPFIWLPSAIWFFFFFDKKYPNGTLEDYYKFFTESWANNLSKKKIIKNP